MKVSTFSMLDFCLNMVPNTYPGKLIAFTGLKGTGKTTLIQNLVGYLEQRGIKAIYSKQHTPEFYENPIFKKYTIDADTVSKGEIDIAGLTFISLGDTLQKLRTELIPCLERGVWVLIDRYAIDQVAGYRVFASNEVEMRVIKSTANLLLKPDRAFLIDLDSAAAIQRVMQRDGKKKGWVYDRSFFDLNNQLFLQFAQANGWVILDGSGSPEELIQRTVKHLKQLFDV